MLTIDCPLCAGEATTDDALVAVDCEACGVTLDIAADTAVPVLERAA